VSHTAIPNASSKKIMKTKISIDEAPAQTATSYKKELFELLEEKSRHAVFCMNKIAEAQQMNLEYSTTYWSDELNATQSTVAELANVLRIAAPEQYKIIAIQTIKNFENYTPDSREIIRADMKKSRFRWFIALPENN
jgi:hypothetical protein